MQQILATSETGLEVTHDIEPLRLSDGDTTYFCEAKVGDTGNIIKSPKVTVRGHD